MSATSVENSIPVRTLNRLDEDLARITTGANIHAVASMRQSLWCSLHGLREGWTDAQKVLALCTSARKMVVAHHRAKA